MTDAGRSAMLNPGPHGFSQRHAVSAANNNGSAFAGLSQPLVSGTVYWRCACLSGFRIIPVMAVPVRRVSKKEPTASSGTFHARPAVVSLLIGTVPLVGALDSSPAWRHPVANISPDDMSEY